MDDTHYHHHHHTVINLGLLVEVDLGTLTQGSDNLQHIDQCVDVDAVKQEAFPSLSNDTVALILAHMDPTSKLKLAACSKKLNCAIGCKSNGSRKESLFHMLQTTWRHCDILIRSPHVIPSLPQSLFPRLVYLHFTSGNFDVGSSHAKDVHLIQSQASRIHELHGFPLKFFMQSYAITHHEQNKSGQISLGPHTDKVFVFNETVESQENYSASRDTVVIGKSTSHKHTHVYNSVFDAAEYWNRISNNQFGFVNQDASFYCIPDTIRKVLLRVSVYDFAWVPKIVAERQNLSIEFLPFGVTNNTLVEEHISPYLYTTDMTSRLTITTLANIPPTVLDKMIISLVPRFLHSTPRIHESSKDFVTDFYRHVVTSYAKTIHLKAYDKKVTVWFLKKMIRAFQIRNHIMARNIVIQLFPPGTSYTYSEDLINAEFVHNPPQEYVKLISELPFEKCVFIQQKQESSE